MDVSLASLLNLHVFSTGRRLYALVQVREAALARQLRAIAARCEAAIAHDQETQRIEVSWLLAQHAPERSEGRTRRLDMQVDRTLVAIRDAIQAQIDGADPSDADHVASLEEMLLTFFPTGIGDVITLGYREELVAVDAIVHKLQREYAALAAEIGIERLARHLAKLAVDYRAVQEESLSGGPQFDQVRAARAEGQDRMLTVVAMVLGAFPSHGKDDLAAREALLGPILLQNEAIQRYMRARREVEDVNPRTGEVDPRGLGGLQPS